MQPGDLFLVHGSTLADRVIRFGEGLRFDSHYAESPAWVGNAWWSHVAVVVGGGDVVEAMGSGVRRTKATEYLSDRKAHDWALVDTHLSDAQRAVAARFAVAQVGDPYDGLAIGGEAFALLTGRKWALRVAGTWICSELAAAAIREATREVIPSRTGICSPADVSAYYGAGFCPER